MTTLVILAAGIGSRFGGTKQLAQVGPSGEAILDYTIFDARRAGFSRFVLIVRSDIEDAVLGHVHKFHPHTKFVTVLQDQSGAPPRTKPWGTAQAVLATRGEVSGSFAVANADDFYGAGAYRILHDFLRAGRRNEYVNVGYRLANTLPRSGNASRGVCGTDEQGLLTSIRETHGIGRREDGAITDADGHTLAPATVVSMNLWGFAEDLFEHLGARWPAFVAAHSDDPRAEFLLPTAVGDLVHEGVARVHVRSSEDDWLGITNPDDLAVVRERVVDLVAGGHYPRDVRTAG